MKTRLMTRTYLERRDPAQNMERFYLIMVTMCKVVSKNGKSLPKG
jgi:predicted DNA-binding WGR domain protein